MRLIVASGSHMQVVQLAGWHIDAIVDARRPIASGWVLDCIADAVTALRAKQGAGLAEYVVTLALVAVVAVVALTFLGVTVGGVFSAVGMCIPDRCR